MTGVDAIIPATNLSGAAPRERPAPDTTEVAVMQQQRTTGARPTAEQRFWAKVNKQPESSELEPCWLWTASVATAGYGYFHAGGKNWRAHRFAYELLVGPIPEGLTLDHLCRNRACVNPAHLEPVTHAVNILRGEGLSAANARKTHCKHGHEFTPENTNYSPTRGRQCRLCKAELNRRRPSRARVSPTPEADQQGGESA